ncbi:hypothetical protein B0H19DRAFT_1370691 [Mycena capillaripes]|nr:hypothetical protein B0H19DRAFT_1377664 [Mycena capillaripes]KAJ6577509.1 hypothetical protein B0H19DRAFT_1370691 [Mycena capillaripes]
MAATTGQRHHSLYFRDGTLTFKTYNGSTYYNVYREPLILKSFFFEGMLKLPAPSSAPASLSQSSRDLLEFAQRSGYDGTSDTTAVTFPETFSNRECEVFLEFIFNLLPWTKETPALDWLCAVLKTCDFFGADSGVEYAIHHLEDHPELGAALRYRLASNYGIDRWAKRAYYELMSGSMLEVTSEDELSLGWDAYRSLVRAHAEVTQYRLALALFPPEVVHSSLCFSHDYCKRCWVDNWMGMSGGVGNLLKDGLTGSEMHDALGNMEVSGMTGECRLLTITSIQDTPGKKSSLRKEEDIIDKAVEVLIRAW